MTSPSRIAAVSTAPNEEDLRLQGGVHAGTGVEEDLGKAIGCRWAIIVRLLGHWFVSAELSGGLETSSEGTPTSETEDVTELANLETLAPVLNMRLSGKSPSLRASSQNQNGATGLIPIKILCDTAPEAAELHYAVSADARSRFGSPSRIASRVGCSFHTVSSRSLLRDRTQVQAPARQSRTEHNCHPPRLRGCENAADRATAIVPENAPQGTKRIGMAEKQGNLLAALSSVSTYLPSSTSSFMDSVSSDCANALRELWVEPD